MKVRLDIQRFSGGAYNYLYNRDAEGLIRRTEDIEKMRDDFIKEGHVSMAKELEYLLFIIRRYEVLAETFMKNNCEPMKAIEWYYSGDYGKQEFDSIMRDWSTT